MLFFGHIGITLGAVAVCQKLAGSDPSENDPLRHGPSSDSTAGGARPLSERARGWLRSIDYRFVIIGAMLPDIIDKPMWLITRNSSIQWDGRGYAHTFLLSFILLAFGLVLALRRDRAWLLTLSFCSFAHLALDRIWLEPVTMWWPLMGQIEQREAAGWLTSLWEGLVTRPGVYIPESLGFLVTVYLALRVLLRRRVLSFLKTGDMPL